MKIFFHHVDMDGRCSGAIVRKFFKGEGEYIGYDYGEFPFDTIIPGEKVIIVDCSCDFTRLLEITQDIIWIDHHKTAIDKYVHLNIPGIQRDGTAACELCWEYFFPDEQKPITVEFLGDYDVWKFQYKNTMPLQLGIRTFDTSIESEMWETWLNNTTFPTTSIDRGKIIQIYRDNFNKGIIKSLSFFCEWEGYKVVCVNQGSTNSQIFDSVDEDYDIMAPFSFNGVEWRISLYTKKDIDVSAIAVKYGGGGHAQAARFNCKELPFSIKNNRRFQNVK